MQGTGRDGTGREGMRLVSEGMGRDGDGKRLRDKMRTLKNATVFVALIR